MADSSPKTRVDEKEAPAVEEVEAAAPKVDEAKPTFVGVTLNPDYENVVDGEVRVAVAGISPSDDFTDDAGRVVLSKKAVKVPQEVAPLLVESGAAKVVDND